MKAYAIAIALIVVIGAAVGVGVFSYRYGREAERALIEQEQVAQRKRVADLLAQIARANAKSHVVTEERIRVIEKSVGSCWDNEITPPEALQALING